MLTFKDPISHKVIFNIEPQQILIELLEMVRKSKTASSIVED